MQIKNYNEGYTVKNKQINNNNKKNAFYNKS